MARRDYPVSDVLMTAKMLRKHVEKAEADADDDVLVDLEDLKYIVNYILQEVDERGK